MSGRKGMTHYDAEIKRKAVRMFLEGHQTYAVIAKELGIRKAARIKVWVRRYRQEDVLSFHTSSGRPRKAEAEQRDLERLCMENALLKKIPYRIAGTAAHAAQYRVIYHSKKEYEGKAMGIFLGVSRAAYYGWESRSEQEDPDRDRMALVQEAYEASHKIYGYRRITLWLKQKHTLVINPKAVLQLMNKLNIRSRARKRKMYKNLEEVGAYHRYPNVLNRDFVATRPNQKWVTDNALHPFRVTYVMTQEGWAYLSVIKDLCDGFIVASAFVRNNSIALVTAF